MIFFGFASPVEAQISNIELNLFLPDAISSQDNITNFENDLGISFYSYKWYLDWSDPLEREIPDRFHNLGKLPELTWQPQIGERGVAFNDVLAKKYDGYLTKFAQDVKGLGYPIRINLAPEMNGSWASWGIGNNGNTPANEKAFWRYVVGKFRTLGATNVQWIWTPNVHFEGEMAGYEELFPGDDVVDFIGLDGYNWGTSQSWSQWQSFREIFESSYNDLVNISSRKILIMETASTEIGGDKASWIREMFQTLPNFPQIQGFTWFNINKETDWRIESSASAKQAFCDAVRGGYPTMNSPQILSENDATPITNNADENAVEDIQVPAATPETTPTPADVLSPPAQEQIPTVQGISDWKLPNQNFDDVYRLQLIINLKIALYFLLASIYGVIGVGQLILVLKKKTA